MTTANERPIEAAYVRSIYDATRNRRLQELGEMPVPKVTTEDLALLDRIDSQLRIDVDDMPLRLELAIEDEPEPPPSNVVELFGFLSDSVRQRGPRAIS